MMKNILLLILICATSWADTPPIIYQFAAPLVKTNNKNISIPSATSTRDGYLAQADWSIFNNKQATLVAADATHNGYLLSIDWNIFNSKEPSISTGTTLQYWRGDKSFQTLNTSVVPEGTNLYYSQTRFDTAFSGKSTTSLAEGSNLYYTQGRFNTAFSGKTTDDLTQGSTNKYYSTSLFNTDFATKTTTNLSEGANLYYTQGRFDSAFSGKSTSNLSEGSNLYYLDSRARGSVSATSPLSYVSGTGVFSIDLSAYAPLASPALTGVPTAPTATVGTSTTQLATTAFVLSQGFQGATGSMPFAHQSSTSVVTNATSTYSTAITTTITTTATSAPVYAKATGVFTVTGAIPTVLKYRVTVNGVSGQEQLLSLTALTTNYTAATQYISASLGPGTYTILFEIARNSGTGTVSFFEGTLDAIALQGTESNGITQLTGALQTGPGSGSQVLTGILPLANGGSNANLTAANGAIPYSTASALAFLAPGTLGQIVRSGGAAAPTWTAETFPASTTINQLLYSSAANVVSGLATANTGVVVTSSAGVPSVTACATANRLLRTNGTTLSCAQANLTTDVTGTLPFAQGGTGATTFANQRIPFSNGTNFTADANFFYDTTNIRLAVGGNSTATVGAVTANGNVGLQSFCSGTNNCAQIRNQSAYNLAMLNANDANVLGILVGSERSRGTQAARTQALNGDIGLNLVGSCYTGAGSSTGFTAQILYNSSEDCTSSANGGEISFATTLNGTTTLVERARITNDGQSKFHYGVTLDTSTAQPTCDAAHRGLQWIIDGTTGVADIFQICQKTALDTYIWVTH